ncbi:MAG: T9SS type A sorting domain-containing protein [Candidatus Kapabacteria bacterium]|nr:T9SS type A sorting domain-containing protein [Candidatus Kapabacteria bacterium]
MKKHINIIRIFFILGLIINLSMIASAEGDKSKIQVNMYDLYDSQPDYNSCSPGALKATEKQAILDYINLIRSYHGLKAVTYDETNQIKAMKAAMLISINNNMTHTPASNEICYSQDAYDGSNQSNLFYQTGSGLGDLVPSLNSVIMWMWDDGQASLGHRQAIINPFLTKIAFGRSDGTPKVNFNGTITSMTLFYQPNVTGSINVDFVACPQNDYNTDLFKKNWLLNFSAFYDKNQWFNNKNIDYSAVSITVSDPDGNRLNVHGIQYDFDGWGSIPNDLKWYADGLMDNVKYTVEIKNAKVNGSVKNYTYTFTLGKGGSSSNPPSVPANLSPVDLTTNFDPAGTLSWANVSGADSYKIQISTDNQFNSTQVDEPTLLTNYYNLQPALSPSTTYFWRVAAVNTKGTSNWTNTIKFTTSAPAPGVIKLYKPVNYAKNLGLTPNFTWAKDASALKYNLQITSVPDDFSSSYIVLELTSLTDTSYNCPKNRLLKNMTYYWRLRMTTSGGTGPWSEVRSFETGDPSIVNEQEPEHFSVAFSKQENSEHYNLMINSNSQNSLDVQIIDLTGNLLFEKRSIEITSGASTIPMNITNISNGVYIYRIITPKSILTGKFVKL